MNKAQVDENNVWKWGEADQKAFETLHECLITPPIVAFPNFDEEFLIFTDANNYGAVQSQMQDDKEVVIHIQADT